MIMAPHQLLGVMIIILVCVVVVTRLAVLGTIGRATGAFMLVLLLAIYLAVIYQLIKVLTG
jgi:hypothetical protein